MEVAIRLWNAQLQASEYWGCPDPKPLAALQKTLRGQDASPGLDEAFEVLSARWCTELSLDRRLVGDWSFEATAAGRHALVFETRLPEGVAAPVPPFGAGFIHVRLNT